MNETLFTKTLTDMEIAKEDIQKYIADVNKQKQKG
jgi:hypothetical protein